MYIFNIICHLFAGHKQGTSSRYQRHAQKPTYGCLKSQPARPSPITSSKLTLGYLRRVGTPVICSSKFVICAAGKLAMIYSARAGPASYF